MKSDSGITPYSPLHRSTAAQYSYKNESDITRLFATEDVRNKYSLRESITGMTLF